MFGALTAVWLRGLQNDLYLQIGLITLIRLAAKNAILIVEFASQRVRDGWTAFDAAIEAARLRFRPIVMTSIAKSEEHPLALQPLMSISYAVFCLKNNIIK